MQNLIECLKINMQLNHPAILVSNQRVAELLKARNVNNLVSFTDYYGQDDPMKAFAKDYFEYTCAVGFKSK